MEKIIIYGAGKIGKQYYDFLKSQQMDHMIDAFCDRNYKQIKNIDAIPVRPYNEVQNKELPFVIAVADGGEICEQLQNEEQLYYNGLEDWIKNCQGDDIERIKIWLAYKKLSGNSGEEGVLDKLDKDIYESVPELGLNKAVKVFGGFCPCCKKKTLFVSYHYWLRDHYKCIFCNSIPRQRALMKVLEKEMPDWRRLKIHESSPSGSTFPVFKQQCSQYTYSYWYETSSLGELLGENVTNQNLENLLFKDEEFDIFITQDVLEHVNYPEKAFMEINRTLKTGGVHIFTTPMYPFAKTRPRIKMDGNTRKYILPEIYHGNPISDNGSLVTYDWGGYDFLKMIDEITGMESKIVEFPNSKEAFENGLEGDFLQVIVSKKVKK